MIKIAYPDYNFRIKTDEGKQVIFDDLRKSWLKLTPEEWVRQNFVRFLIARNYPQTLIAIEKKITVGEMVKRFDILIFDEAHQPWMMIECKSTAVDLSQDVLSQVLRYNIAVPCLYLVITNGSYCMVFRKSGVQLVEVDEFPGWG
jgi:hypothetical protein